MKADLWNPEPERDRGRCAPPQRNTAKFVAETRSQFPCVKDVGDNKIRFGKHRGKSIRQIDQCDPGYLDWILRAGAGGAVVVRDVKQFMSFMHRDDRINK